jgi:hypothetical protein
MSTAKVYEMPIIDVTPEQMAKRVATERSI